MYKIITLTALFVFSFSQLQADFMFQETDPYCSLSGNTHTSFPGEISDTSSWHIPTVYEGECESVPELSPSEQEAIFNIMYNFFERHDFIGPIYGEIGGYGGSDTLNPEGQDFVNKKLFPAMIAYITKEREAPNPDTKSIAILHYATSTIGYDYYLHQPE